MKKILLSICLFSTMFVASCSDTSDYYCETSNLESNFIVANGLSCSVLDTSTESTVILSSTSNDAHILSLDESSNLIQSLEELYDAKISYPNNIGLTIENIKEIEAKIVELKKILDISLDNVLLDDTIPQNIKTRSIESMTIETNAVFLVATLKVAVSIDNDTSCLIESWYTGISKYESIRTCGIYHDFNAGQNQQRISFGFTLVATTTLPGDTITVTVDEDVKGWVDFASRTGSLNTVKKDNK